MINSRRNRRDETCRKIKRDENLTGKPIAMIPFGKTRHIYFTTTLMSMWILNKQNPMV
jgi:hypothetical protein